MKSATVRVYASGPDPQTPTVCAKRLGSRAPARFLGHAYGVNGHGERWGAKLFDAAGDHVAFAEFAEDFREGGRGSQVHSVNLRTGRYREYAVFGSDSAWESNQRRVTDVEIDARGRIAWIEASVGSSFWDVGTFRVFAAARGGPTMRAEGEQIDRDSLTRRGETVFWRDGGERASARLG